METTYKMSYRQRVYGHPSFPNHKIQQLGDGPVLEVWPNGSPVSDSQKEEDVLIEIQRTVSPYAAPVAK